MERMTAPARFIILVIGIVVGAAVLLAPRGNEQLAMLQDEDKHAQIIALLEPRVARGENDPNLLATLGRAYGEVGSYQRAIELMERYTSLRPDDAEAYARLAELYGKVNDVTRQIAMLERSVAIAPTLARAIDLAALYRQENQVDKELALLSRFELRADGREWTLVATGRASCQHGRPRGCDRHPHAQRRTSGPDAADTNRGCANFPGKTAR